MMTRLRRATVAPTLKKKKAEKLPLNMDIKSI